jgi:hypothetical protein
LIPISHITNSKCYFLYFWQELSIYIGPLCVHIKLGVQFPLARLALGLFEAYGLAAAGGGF